MRRAYCRVCDWTGPARKSDDVLRRGAVVIPGALSDLGGHTMSPAHQKAVSDLGVEDVV